MPWVGGATIKTIYFFLIVLNRKIKWDGRLISRNKEAKVEVTFSKNIILIIWSHIFNFCFSKNVGIYKNNSIKTSKNNLGIDIIDIDKNRKTKNLNIIDKNIVK